MSFVLADVSEEARTALQAALSALPYPGLRLRSIEADLSEADLVVMQEAESVEQTVAALRRHRRRGPVVVLCSSLQEKVVDALLDAGAVDVFELPLTAPLLRARLHALLREQEQRREDESLRALLELTQTLASTLDFQDILYTVVSRIAEVVRVDRVSIVLVPDGPDVGYVVAASDDEQLNKLPLALRKYPEILHVLATKKPLTIDDVSTHPVLDGVRGSVSDVNVRALTLLPIMSEREMMGVLFLRGESESGALSARQLGFCQVLANATAVALRNARTLQNLRDETRRDTRARLEAERHVSTLRTYADLFASVVYCVIAFNRRGQLEFANPAAYTLFDVTPEEMKERGSLLSLVAEESKRKAKALAGSFARQRYPHDVDLVVNTNRGERIINGSFSPLRETGSAVLFAFRDVTDDRALQRELESTRHFLQSMIDASVDAIVAADMKGNIILFNDAAHRLYGYSPEEAKASVHVSALYPGDGARDVARMLKSPAHGGKGRLQPVRMEAVNAAGQVFPISLTAATLYEGDEPSATFGIFTDLRDRLRVEEQLAHAQEKLAVTEKQALVAELAGAMAHELNQPLTSVMASAELLLRRLEPRDDLRTAVHRLYGEAARIAEIVKKIGHLTKYETTAYVGKQKILDLDRAARSDTEHEDVGEVS